MTPRADAGRAASAVLLAAALLSATLLSSAFLGCATSAPAPAPGGAVRHHYFVEDGRASFYGRTFEGRRTASGETYDPERMTAAHPTLPFGTWIRVTRLGGAAAGAFVEVRVNDRCGCGGGRIVDLSRAAARRLDMIRVGVVPVRLEVIEK